ncbi:MAG: hypothetical protein CME71_07925 [Halobacteriovorax sp.]|nr:hypothetical protein [Halobacteriovorax sp.]
MLILIFTRSTPISSLKNIPEELLPLIPGYLENRSKELLELRSLVSSNDLEGIKKIGHKLAGNAGSYGLPELGAIGAKLEESVIMDNINSLLNEYESLLKNYQEDISKL